MLSSQVRVGLLSLVLSLLGGSRAGAQLLNPILEPDDGRDPIVAALNQATASIDLYLFILTLPSDDPIVAALAGAVAAGVGVRAVLEPCPGEGAACTPPTPDAINACQMLTEAGVVVKWANPAFTKTHAKSTLIDGATALVTTINLEPSTFTVRRDYGVVTDDLGVVAELAQVFAQDWADDDPIADCTQAPNRAADPRVQSYSTLVVTPDNARALLVGSPGAPGFLRAPTSTLLIEMEKLDPQEGRGVIPAIRETAARGVTVRVLLNEASGSLDQANAVIAAGGQALCKRNLHAKLMIADGQQLFLGSQNLTRDSLDLRREIGWIIYDPTILTQFGATFASDWDAAVPCAR